MSKNKGKDGELMVVKILSDVRISTNDVDITRPTTTNTADLGADIVLYHPRHVLKEIADIAGATFPSSEKTLHPEKQNEMVKSRIDVKTTTKKLQKDIVEKFVDDVNNHPKATGHILIGRQDLTGPSKKLMAEAQQRLSAEGKDMVYINNSGRKKLETYYRKKAIESENQNKTEI